VTRDHPLHETPAGSLPTVPAAADSTGSDAGAGRPLLERAAIVATARQIIAEHGLEALSLRRIGDTMGVTAPALYAHVDDKQDLLRAVAELQMEELLTRYEAVRVDDPLDRVRGHCRAYLDLARDEPELFRVMFLFPPDLGPGARSDLPDDLALPAATRAFLVATDAIDDAIAQGQIVSDDPLTVALTIWASIHGMATILQMGFGLPEDLERGLIDEVIDRILRAYRA